MLGPQLRRPSIAKCQWMQSGAASTSQPMQGGPALLTASGAGADNHFFFHLCAVQHAASRPHVISRTARSMQHKVAHLPGAVCLKSPSLSPCLLVGCSVSERMLKPTFHSTVTAGTVLMGAVCSCEMAA